MVKRVAVVLCALGLGWSVPAVAQTNPASQAARAWRQQHERAILDEFVALLTDAPDPAALNQTVVRLIEAVERPVPLDGGRAHGLVSASIGVARFPQDGEDFDTLLEHADQAMYRAKLQGRGGFALFQASLDGQPREGSDGELRQAFDQDELQLYFQPVIDTDTGQAVGAEALVQIGRAHV